jgi:4a-hydroxytetrahydrobiopterin dehydratase
MEELVGKHCIPCEGGTPPMDSASVQKLLKEVGGSWQINAQGHIYKKYLFKNFMEPLDFINKIAVLAEQEGHHPNLAFSWGWCDVEIWTHKIGGLTESDFILAAKIEAIK